MIQKLNLVGFTCFQDISLEFCPGINILLGANGTGKTHILKIISAILKSNEELLTSQTQAKERFESLMAERLIAYFKPEQLGRLVKRQPGRSGAGIELHCKNKTVQFLFSTNSKSSVKVEKNDLSEVISSLYLPPREIFSVYEGLLGLYEKREISFDEPYILLAKALDPPLLKGRRFEETRVLIEPLEQEIGAKVIKENGRFYLRDDTGKMEAHLVAEGMRKIATLMYLISNGELAQNSVLFWDEPEANLNPKLIVVIAKFLRLLANHGVQIFIASHDFLLTQQLSLWAEYRDTNPGMPETKFFCLSKEAQNIVVEYGSTLSEIDNNPILEEFAAYHDLEQKLFSQALTT